MISSEQRPELRIIQKEDPVISLRRSASFWRQHSALGFGDQLEALAEWLGQRTTDPNVSERYAVATGTQVADAAFHDLETAGSYAQHHGPARETALVLPISEYGLGPDVVWVPATYTPIEYGLVRRQWDRTHRNRVLVLHRGSESLADHYLSVI